MSQPPPPPPQHHGHAPAILLQTLLRTIEHSIIPLTTRGVSSGSKLFGAAILSKATLEPLTVATNNEAESPLLHGEINCIQQFFSTSSSSSSSSSSPSNNNNNNNNNTFPPEQRPDPRDCVFLTTHEPCSLCLSGIAWAGFDNFYYLFTYADSRDLFAIPYDIRILEQVFRVPATDGAAESEDALARRPLYNRRNEIFTATSFEELLGEVGEEDGGERERLRGEVERVRGLYGELSRTYQEGKKEGVESRSFWK
ncbi:cytidine/deoxycytidylate deaminase family protein [Xylariomycetidae sp. FL2044]|nr:cytidine/deoxycytidylate deaminase family protein [Xylariomycetidae sp. FL2044]